MHWLPGFKLGYYTKKIYLGMYLENPSEVASGAEESGVEVEERVVEVVREDHSSIPKCYTLYEYIIESGSGGFTAAAVVDCGDAGKGLWLSRLLTRVVSGEVLVPYLLAERDTKLCEIVMRDSSIRDGVYFFTTIFPALPILWIKMVFHMANSVLGGKRRGRIVEGAMKIYKVGKEEAIERSGVVFVKTHGEEE
jgi:hypothetical protein